MTEVKTVRLNEAEHELLLQARSLLLHKGINGLDEELQSRINKEIGKELGRFTLGLIVGVAAAILITELSR